MTGDRDFVVKYSSVIAGAAAGVTGTVVGHPFDLVKVRLATASSIHHRQQKEWLKSNPESTWRRFHPPSAFSTARKILKAEGWRSFFKGVCSPIASLVLMNSVAYSAFDNVSRRLSRLHGTTRGAAEESRAPPALRHRAPLVPLVAAASGALSGLCVAPIGAPFELVKLRSQMDNVRPGGARFRGSWQVARALLTRHRSLAIFYTGFSLQLPRELIYGCVFFGSAETIRPVLAHALPQSSLNLAAIPLAAGCAGSLAWLAVQPIDVLKINYQTGKIGKHDRPPILSIFRKLARSHKNPVKAFFVGSTVAITRAFVVSSIRYSTFGMVLYMLDKKNER